jgi:HK97 family phage prohead protease
MKRKTYAFETKELKDDGEFTGYASVFGTVDYYGDVIHRGAFTDSIAAWKKRGRFPPLLWQHSAQLPVGPHLDMYEDEKGLYVHAKLLVDEVEKAREARALLKAKVLGGMSIGFDIVADAAKWDNKRGGFDFYAVELWENSLVTFPANPDAQIDEVKTLLASGKLPAPSDFEEFLRDAGFNRRQAKYIASHGYTSLRDAGPSLRDEEPDTDTIRAAMADLSNYLGAGK